MNDIMAMKVVMNIYNMNARIIPFCQARLIPLCSTKSGRISELKIISIRIDDSIIPTGKMTHH